MVHKLSTVLNTKCTKCLKHLNKILWTALQCDHLSASELCPKSTLLAFRLSRRFCLVSWYMGQRKSTCSSSSTWSVHIKQRLYSAASRSFLTVSILLLLLLLLLLCTTTSAGLGGSAGCASDWRSVGCWFDPRRVEICSWRFDHGIFSTVSLSLPLIQEGNCQLLED